MTNQSSNASRQASLLFWCKAAIAGGVAAGAFDAVYFFARAFMKGQPLTRPLHNVAAFWLGNESFSGGALTAALGLTTHFGLAIIMAAGYALIALNASFVRKRPYIFGPAYGVILYVVMYHGVMVLRWPSLFPRFSGWNSVLTIAVHVIFGLIIALVLRQLDKRRGRARRQLTAVALE